ncbi:MAG TPA: zf-HC2 domain-containing protein, partial [Longimicrobiales bacterium]|nr:zf-HC2 domain-containing protein [Longimicrobiales bacterium]
MTHATEGMLIAYVDGEMEGPAAAELRDHLAACDVCAGELRALEGLSARAHRLLAAMDVAPPMLRARAAIGAARPVRSRRGLGRLGLGGLARAAVLVLVLAGVAAA